MHLEECLWDEHVGKCLDDLDEIKIPLKENGMDEEEEMPIITWISELIDERTNRRKEPSLPEVATNIERTRTGSREGSVGVEEDIEAQN
ncbi:hypothetical protein NL676_019106 [Syzygium grande]|nr:hypothetical protein NL676_019106 [Syzygium grande]